MTPIDQLLWGGFAVAVAVSAALVVVVLNSLKRRVSPYRTPND
jgi:hypothetical protein